MFIVVELMLVAGEELVCKTEGAVCSVHPQVLYCMSAAKTRICPEFVALSKQSVHAWLQLELDRVVSLHLSGGLLGANSTAADVAKLVGALMFYIAEQKAGPGLVILQGELNASLLDAPLPKHRYSCISLSAKLRYTSFHVSYRRLGLSLSAAMLQAQTIYESPTQ